MHLSPPPSGLGCCPLQGGGPVVLVVDDYFVDCCYHCGVLCLFRVLLSIALYSFSFCNHLAEERTGCFTLSYWCLVIVIVMWLLWVGLQCVIVGHLYFLITLTCVYGC